MLERLWIDKTQILVNLIKDVLLYYKVNEIHIM